ncbi:MerR family transcriptional regulator [Streptomyces sp. NPDC051173]|uniref:MerR family transcriptional regulator n=1 Tax=Streptomyces sp. NPDC051173 TaxID=3155164 RepID=UPI00344B8F13
MAVEYRIDDLAHHSGATARTIRAYQDRGLLPRPERRGRANVYGEAHLARLQRIAGLLDRGYTLASIKELLDAWDAGRDLGGVLGLVAEVDGPWTDEQAERITRAALDERFGGAQDDAVSEAVRLGVLVPVTDAPDEFLVPSPRELTVAAELHLAGVPLPAISGHLRELRTHVEHIAARFLDFTTEHVFHQFFDHPPTDEEAAEAAALVRRLRPLAQQTVDAELARAMRSLATRYLRHRLEEHGGSESCAETAGDPFAGPAGDSFTGPAGDSAAGPAEILGTGPGEALDTGRAEAPATGPAEALAAGPAEALGTGPAEALGTGPAEALGTGPAETPGTGPATGPDPLPLPTPGAPPGPHPHRSLRLPARTLEAVRELVGEEHVAAFVAAAAEREVRARVMDGLLPRDER